MSDKYIDLVAVVDDHEVIEVEAFGNGGNGNMPEKHRTFLLDKVGVKSIDDLIAFNEVYVDGEYIAEIYDPEEVLSDVQWYRDLNGENIDTSSDNNGSNAWGWGNANILSDMIPVIFSYDPLLPMMFMVNIEHEDLLYAIEM
jgi:hypothetical protein